RADSRRGARPAERWSRAPTGPPTPNASTTSSSCTTGTRATRTPRAATSPGRRSFFRSSTSRSSGRTGWSWLEAVKPRLSGLPQHTADSAGTDPAPRSTNLVIPRRNLGERRLRSGRFRAPRTGRQGRARRLHVLGGEDPRDHGRRDGRRRGLDDARPRLRGRDAHLPRVLRRHARDAGLGEALPSALLLGGRGRDDDGWNDDLRLPRPHGGTRLREVVDPAFLRGPRRAPCVASGGGQGALRKHRDAQGGDLLLGHHPGFEYARHGARRFRRHHDGPRLRARRARLLRAHRRGGRAPFRREAHSLRGTLLGGVCAHAATRRDARGHAHEIALRGRARARANRFLARDHRGDGGRDRIHDAVGKPPPRLDLRVAAMRALGRLAPLAVLLGISRAVWAGPPFVTDDPEPVDLGHWEINDALTATWRRGETSAGLPIDVNYGAA